MKGLALHQRKPSKKVKNDNWWTPLWLFIQLCLIYNFHPKLDVCADKKNSKCDKFFTKKDDALTKSWYDYRISKSYYDVWCNPPNSKLGLFLRKAWEEYKKHKGHVRIMMIVPTNVMSSNAWWDAVENPKDLGEKIFYKPLYKRIQFLDKGKKPDSSARNAYLVVIWG